MSKISEDWAWKALVSNCHRWASNHMDQWEKFKFDTRHGPVYVTISRQDPYPDDFGKVDMIGGKVDPVHLTQSQQRAMDAAVRKTFKIID